MDVKKYERILEQLPANPTFSKGQLVAKAFKMNDGSFQWYIGKVGLVTAVSYAWCKFEDAE